MAGINLTQAAQSFLAIYNQINAVATETVGIDVHYMRALPHEKSEDVLFHEYTLHDVDCPKTIKFVTSNTSYNPGNFSVDYFGINYESPFEVSVDTSTWVGTFGQDTMPQQHDIVYVDVLNCLYEVATSTIEYGFSNQETGFKMQLTKWNPRANVRLNQGVEDTIEDLTVGINELFGEEISKQVADIVDEPETSQMLNTAEPENDIFKTRDLDSVKIGDVDMEDNTVARSYYDMSNIVQTIFYKNGDFIDVTETENRRYFSCWFKIKDTNIETTDIGSLVQENGKYYIENINPKYVKSGEIELNRGAFLQLHAIVNKVANVNGQTRYMLTFNNTEFRDMTKKISNWNKNLTLTTSNVTGLLKGRVDKKCTFNIAIISGTTLLVKFGSKSKRIAIGQVPVGQWCGIGINMGKESNAYIYTKDDNGVLKCINQINLGDLSNTFEVGEYYLPKTNTLLTNIRLYKVDYLVDQKTIEKDLNWQLAKNDSKTIVNDNAAVPNTSPFITSQR